ncbi:MAG: hypothetical protein R2764_02280 [Bacteroidales bacterium]
MKQRLLNSIIFCSLFVLVAMNTKAQQVDPEDNYFNVYEKRLEYIEKLAVDKGVDITEPERV